MLKIWGRVNSVNVKKALWCLEELKLPYQRVDAGMQFGVVDTPEYRRLNPNGLVPTIDDDGFVLWESHTIVRYLSMKHGRGTLWPADDRTWAEASKWMDWAFTFLASMRPVFWNLVRTPPEKRDMAAVEDGRKKCAQLAGMLDAALSGRRYVAGDGFTMGDIPVGCHMHLWLRLPLERPRHPNLEGWFARLLERPAYRKIVDIAIS
ncbi:MAG TPA: glutathione S-transferase [Burkholderiales bacterium]|nr:glutathione S-transferase [Burkholderiales bacterium]